MFSARRWYMVEFLRIVPSRVNRSRDTQGKMPPAQAPPKSCPASLLPASTHLLPGHLLFDGNPPYNTPDRTDASPEPRRTPGGAARAVQLVSNWSMGGTWPRRFSRQNSTRLHRPLRLSQGPA